MTETVDTISWVDETARSVGLARNADKARKQAKRLDESTRELGRLLTQVKNLRASAVVVRGVGWEGQAPSPALSQLLEESLRTLGSRPLDRVEIELGKFINLVDASLKEQWNDHATQQLGDVTELVNLSQTLAGVEGIAEVSQELNVTLGEVERSRSSLPTGQSIELLTKAVELLRGLESSLTPDSVRRFLAAVARGGAPVDSLTSDVTEWLNDHNATYRFKIVAGSPAGDSDE
ncbi:hypothetical protein [Prescottella equi]|uniref:hypothetical protein n=1 Tax=Rhodococcus hoagii TaxID=43767 RepID=UPI000A11C2E2|nr:hypothetical protein [Prescottella equi]ORM08378.1 hypothetical protein A5N77_20095 [Prescottella equi]